MAKKNQAQSISAEEVNTQEVEATETQEVAAVNVEDNSNAPKAKAKKTPTQAQQGKKKRGFFKAIGKWFKELFSELKKVTWPTAKDVSKNTAVVVIVVVVFFILLFAIDYVLAGLLSLLINGKWATLFIS